MNNWRKSFPRKNEFVIIMIKEIIDMSRICIFLILSVLFVSCKQEKERIVNIPCDDSFVRIPMGDTGSFVRIGCNGKKGMFYVQINDVKNGNIIEYDNYSGFPALARELKDKKIFMYDLNGDLMPDMAKIDFKNGNVYKTRIDYCLSEYGKDTRSFVPLDKAIEKYGSKEKSNTYSTDSHKIKEEPNE